MNRTSTVAPARLTTLADRASVENNELPLRGAPTGSGDAKVVFRDVCAAGE